MVSRGVIWIAFAAGCGNPTPVASDAPTDAMVDAEIPCTLPAINLAVATLAGCEQQGMADGAREVARFANPVNVAISLTETYVADFDNDRVRKLGLDGTTQTLVSLPSFHKPFGLVIDPAGTLYVETDDNDSSVHSDQTGTIWRVDPSSGAAVVVARDLGRPRGLAMLADGRIALADYRHHVLSILDPSTGVVTPLAGASDQAGFTNDTGAAARFAQPYDLVLLPDGDLVVSDLTNRRLRRVTLAGVVTDFAGTGASGNEDGPVATASFEAPQGLAIGEDMLYVSDVKHHVIRRVELTTGMVTTIAGDGTGGWRDTNSPMAAEFYGLEGLDVRGNRLVAADGNVGDGESFNRIRTVDLSMIP